MSLAALHSSANTKRMVGKLFKKLRMSRHIVQLLLPLLLLVRLIQILILILVRKFITNIKMFTCKLSKNRLKNRAQGPGPSMFGAGGPARLSIYLAAVLSGRRALPRSRRRRWALGLGTLRTICISLSLYIYIYTLVDTHENFNFYCPQNLHIFYFFTLLINYFTISIMSGL